MLKKAAGSPLMALPESKSITYECFQCEGEIYGGWVGWGIIEERKGAPRFHDESVA